MNMTRANMAPLTPGSSIVSGRKRTNIGGEALTVENWRTSTRARWSAGILMGIRVVERKGGGYKTIYGTPPQFGSIREFDTLEDALAHANTDQGGMMIWFDDGPKP